MCGLPPAEKHGESRASRHLPHAAVTSFDWRLQFATIAEPHRATAVSAVAVHLSRRLHLDGHSLAGGGFSATMPMCLASKQEVR